MLYLSVTILVAGMSIPIMSTALDTVYSRILGNIDQSVAHGAMAVIDDILYMITPIFTTFVITTNFLFLFFFQNNVYIIRNWPIMDCQIDGFWYNCANVGSEFEEDWRTFVLKYITVYVDKINLN